MLPPEPRHRYKTLLPLIDLLDLSEVYATPILSFLAMRDCGRLDFFDYCAL